MKSAYWLSTHLPDNAPPQPPPGNLELKHMLWRLKTAPKIKHFFWKLLSGALPTGDILRHRYIHGDSDCKRCCRGTETIQHLFFDCEYARAIWRGSGIPNPVLYDPTTNWEDKVKAIFSFNSCETVYLRQLPLWIVWRLWKSRNILTFQRRNISWRNSLILAKRDAKEWQDVAGHTHATTKFRSTLGLNGHMARHWTKPPIGWIKCNYDGSYNRGISSKAGWIIRNDSGGFVGAGQAKGRITNSSLESEFQALIISMQNCWSKGYTRVCFEGDNKELAEILNGKVSHFGAYNWIREVQAWRVKFQDCRFLWVRRTQNKPADILAKQSIPQESSFYFHYYVPVVISNALHMDHFSFLN